MSRSDFDQPGPTLRSSPPLLAWLGLCGLLVHVGAFIVIQPYQFNLVRYELQAYRVNSWYVPPFLFGMALTLAPLMVSVVATRRAAKPNWRDAAPSLAPLLLSLPVAAHAVLSGPPPFLLPLLMIAGSAASVFLAARDLPEPIVGRRGHWLAAGALVILLASLVLLHVRVEINFWRHLMLGHADIGHFAEELKNALTGRGLRCDSFEHVRLGWHFVPLLYSLVPLYALWPSPVMLMTIGAILLHLVALPLYFAVRRGGASPLTAWMVAAAWLLAPSISRLVYSNTYGFHWVYASMPLIACMMAAGLTGRWRVSAWLTVPAMLVRETVAVAVLGWGFFAAFAARRRAIGLLMVAASIGYLLLCTTVLIPYFAGSGTYQRLSVFGSVGGTPAEAITALVTNPSLLAERVFRREAGYFVAVLLVTTAGLPLFNWRMGLAAVPALLPVVLMENPQWLNVKFWHHALLLPFLFLAALPLIRPSHEPGDKTDTDGALPPPGTSQATPLSVALMLLVACGWGHYLFGFSPISKSFEAYRDSAFLQQPDPRMAFVEGLRETIPRRHTILATERLAAHFWDYQRLYTGRRPKPADYVLIDSGDTWDTSGLPQRVDEYLENEDYTLIERYGTIYVFRKQTDATTTTGRE